MEDRLAIALAALFDAIAFLKRDPNYADEVWTYELVCRLEAAVKKASAIC